LVEAFVEKPSVVEHMIMRRIAVLVLALAAFSSQDSYGDEVRHVTFSGSLQGAWVLDAAQCDAKDEPDIAISETKYTASGADCAVEWIVETAGALGSNYAVHASCVDRGQPAKANATNLIIRPVSGDRISVGKSFDDLKAYQRCGPR
jgi:hypothetical protein